MHEFGHVLGLLHEHQRWIGDFDLSDDKVAAYESNEQWRRTNYMARDYRTHIDPFEYDADSIMHYDLDLDAFKNIRRRRPIYTDNDNHLYTDLSTKDAKLVAYLYPRPCGGTFVPRQILLQDRRHSKARR